MTTHKSALQSLNPFEIRAGQKRLCSAHGEQLFCLNPFEIRAGQKPSQCRDGEQQYGLNPFEIRAGQKLGSLEHRHQIRKVLIPLKSGQARNSLYR